MCDNKSMKINLRSFVYLDSKLVRDFLSQSDKGYYYSEKISDSSSERTIEQNDNSEFERLHQILVERGLEKTSIDSEQDWADVDSGDILELDMVVSVNFLNSMLSNPDMRLLMLSQTNNSETGFPVEKILGNDVTATAKLAGTVNYSFLMNLQSDSIRKPDDIAGELTVLCKVHRKLKTDETQLALSISNAFKQIVTEQSDLSELKQIFENAGLDSSGLEVHAPGAILIPLAIYR
jgi:hypothetical protein